MSKLPCQRNYAGKRRYNVIVILLPRNSIIVNYAKEHLSVHLYASLS